MNTTLSTQENAYFNKTFYDRKLLDTAKTRLVHANFGQKRSLPRHNGGPLRRDRSFSLRYQRQSTNQSCKRQS